MWARPKISKIGCGPIFGAAMTPRQNFWFLKLRISSLSWPSPTQKPCFWKSTWFRKTSPSTTFGSRTTSPILTSRSAMKSIPVFSLPARSRSRTDSTLVPTQIQEQRPRLSDSWTVFFPLKNVQTQPTRSVSTIIWANAMPIPFARQTRLTGMA